jgi:hypothetical protein
MRRSTLALLLLAMFLNVFPIWCTSCRAISIEPTPYTPPPEKLSPETTDAYGQAAFQTDQGKVMVHVEDESTGEPLSDIEVMLIMDGEKILAMAADPEDRYAIGLGVGTLRRKTASASMQVGGLEIFIGLVMIPPAVGYAYTTLAPKVVETFAYLLPKLTEPYPRAKKDFEAMIEEAARGDILLINSLKGQEGAFMFAKGKKGQLDKMLACVDWEERRFPNPFWVIGFSMDFLRPVFPWVPDMTYIIVDAALEVYPPCAEITGPATVLVLDISGSMDDRWQGGVKLESAKKAALDLLTVIRRENQASRIPHQVAIVTFDTDSELVASLTTNYDQVEGAIARLEAGGDTNLGAGLSIANTELSDAAEGPEKLIVLLSDGMSNEGLSRQEILEGPVQEAALAGTCIYTIGFGDPGDLDEDLLREIAEATCGQYYYAPNAYKLGNRYIKIRQESLGEVVGEFEGQVKQGETVTVGEITVAPGQDELHATLNWSGSILDLILTDPLGRQVDQDYPGATIFAGIRPASVIIKNPLPGTWQAAIFGRDVSEEFTDYYAVFSTRRVITSRDRYSWLLVPILLGGAAILLILISIGREEQVTLTGLTCPICGNTNRPGAHFCKHCGTELPSGRK